MLTSLMAQKNFGGIYKKKSFQDGPAILLGDQPSVFINWEFIFLKNVEELIMIEAAWPKGMV